MSVDLRPAVEGWATIYKERHRETGEVERVWYAIGPQRESREHARSDMPMAAITYTVEGVLLGSGRNELIYAGPSREMAQEAMAEAGKGGRYLSFNSRWWTCGDVDGADFNGDGSPML